MHNFFNQIGGFSNKTSDSLRMTPHQIWGLNNPAINCGAKSYEPEPVKGIFSLFAPEYFPPLAPRQRDAGVIMLRGNDLPIYDCDLRGRNW